MRSARRLTPHAGTRSNLAWLSYAVTRTSPAPAQLSQLAPAPAPAVASPPALGAQLAPAAAAPASAAAAAAPAAVDLRLAPPLPHACLACGVEVDIHAGQARPACALAA
jgi:hypothetical protein